MRETVICLLVFAFNFVALIFMYRLGRRSGYLVRSLEEADLMNEILDNVRKTSPSPDVIAGVLFVVDKFKDELWEEV